MLRKILAVMLALFAAAVIFIPSVRIETGSMAGIIQKPPAPAITAGGKKVPTVTGTYSWRWLATGVCADSPSPYDIFEMYKKQGKLDEYLVQAKAGDEVNISFGYKPHEIGINGWNGNTAEKTGATAFKLPEKPGIYVYDVWARWKRGAGSFAFFIEVK